jgi:two-component system, NarL family, response regulator NreC
MTGPIKILLVEDHKIVREGIQRIIAAEPDMTIVGEAMDGLMAVEKAFRLKPDLVILDLSLPGLGGLDVALQVKRRLPNTRIVVLSMHATEAHTLAALRNGALAYVLKDSGSSELIRAVHEAMAGRCFLDPAIAERAIVEYQHKASEMPSGRYECLSMREREVLHLAAEGFTSAGIAARLFISTRTAEHHRAAALRKLGLRGPMALARFAVEQGIHASPAEGHQAR